MQLRTVIVGFLLAACSVLPSHAPLGGNYALPQMAPAGDRHAQRETAVRPEAAEGQPVPAMAAASALLSTADAGALTQVAPADAIHFEPLQVGSRVKAEVTLSTSVEIRSGPPSLGNGTLSLTSRLRLELTVRKVSAQSVDELELTLTTLSLHSEFDGHGSDDPAGPPQTYDIGLSGSPTIRARTGSDVDPVERAKIALLVVPLSEFCGHWTVSPTLELKPGWTSTVSLPFAAALFATAPDESMHLGPLRARFVSRSRASNDVPFDLSFPLQYASSLGKIQLDLTGSAVLNANSGRPTAIDLSGSLSATFGPLEAQLSVSGTAKLAGTLSYP